MGAAVRRLAPQGATKRASSPLRRDPPPAPPLQGGESGSASPNPVTLPPRTLSDAELDRYARQMILPALGATGQVRLAHARVVVLGAGGIGCPVLRSLAAAGVGAIRVVDDDAVELSNLPRQTLYAEADLGRPKADAAADAVRRLNRHVAVSGRAERITAESVAALTDGADLVVDGTDTFATRLVVGDHLVRARIPLLSAAVGRFGGQVGAFRGWDDGPCYRCFVGDAHDADDCDSCAEVGVFGPFVGWVAELAALQAARLLGGVGEARWGELVVVDGLRPALRAIRIAKDPACRTCGGG